MDAMIIVWIAVAIVGLVVFLWFFPVTLWFQALISGVRISLIQLVLMRWRGVSPNTIVMAMVTGTKAGLTLYANELEAHYLAKGNVPKVVNALISADKANISLDFKMAAAIDLAGRDVFEAVQMSVNPKVINTPPVTAVAKDGIQLIAKARVTVRANIKQLVGGAGEETVLARVGEGIVSSIGSAESHKLVLENPDSISKVVLNKGLDAGTAFEILSIDIADIDIGKNIGAVLQMDQAEADRRIAQAKAEERRAIAAAREQEMIAAVQEMRARVVEAEAQVPLAMAEALRTGKLGVMDYYQMKNVIHLLVSHSHIGTGNILHGGWHGVSARDGHVAVGEAHVLRKRAGLAGDFRVRTQIDQRGHAMFQQECDVRSGGGQRRIAAKKPEIPRQHGAGVRGGLEQAGHGGGLPSWNCRHYSMKMRW